VLGEIDFLLQICDRFLTCFTRGVKLLVWDSDAHFSSVILWNRYGQSNEIRFGKY